jgi:hypothetical protein
VFAKLFSRCAHFEAERQILGGGKICLFGNKEKYNPEQILILKLLLLWYIIAL